MTGARWSYAATVLYPAQALKRAGVSIGAARSATSVPGIFACGDVRFSPVKRVAAAVGEGSMAIAFVHQYLNDTGG